MNYTRRALDHKPLREGIIFVADVGIFDNLGSGVAVVAAIGKRGGILI